jgi:AcrR family transcriptional regulator
MLKTERAQESLRDRKKREKLEAIDAAARRLFRELGYQATTTRAIAEAAGIGTGTLFVYYPEKLDLLVHLYQRDLARVTDDALDALPEGTPLVEACARAFDAVFEFYERDTELARTFVKELVFLSFDRQPEMVATTFRYLARLADLVTAAQARGEVRADVPAPLTAHHLFGIYYWGLVNWLSGALTREQLSLQVRMSLDLLMRGLSAAGSAR